MKAVGAARKSDDGSPSAQMRAKEHDVFASVLHHSRVMDGLNGIRDRILGEDRVPGVSPDDVAFHRLNASSSKIVW